MHSTQLSFPWGKEDLFVQNENVTVKILYIELGEAFSLQYHHHREEFWRILEGNPTVIVGDETIHGQPGQEFFVPKETKHRITAETDRVVVLEIARGVFDEGDIVRLEDKYNR